MWVADQRYDVLGTTFRVQSTDPAIGGMVHGLLAGFGATGRPAARLSNTFSFVAPQEEGERARLYRDCKAVAVADTWGRPVAQLLTDLNRRAIESYDSFAAHAGAVAVDGQVVAFPVVSGGGKSTLTAACLLHGFDYVSDEGLCLDFETGLVVPYARPLMLGEQSLDLLGVDKEPMTGSSEVPLNPGDLNAITATGELTLAHVVIPEFGHDEPALEAIGTGDVMATLLRMSFNNYKHPEEAFRLAARVAPTVQGWRLSYGDPLEAARYLRAELFG